MYNELFSLMEIQVLTQNFSISPTAFEACLEPLHCCCLLPLSAGAGEVDDKSFTFMCLSDDGFNMTSRVIQQKNHPVGILPKF